jgi:signal transduction histidine kinase
MISSCVARSAVHHDPRFSRNARVAYRSNGERSNRARPARGIRRHARRRLTDFYAATKRKGQSSSETYEPTLTVATKNLGDKVEIRIRDNGPGIPPEVKEKMFNPFFTTKPAGEGTGLGLSITHDIIVKQHSGSIEIDTRPSEFTEVRIILPRAPTLPP